MQRRTLLTGIGAVACAKGGPQPLVGTKSTSHMPPRKVIVGTVMQSFWEEHPGLEKRLDQLALIIDRMSEASKRKYGRDLDLAILPEAAITGEVGGDALSRAVPFDGAVSNTFARKAREHRCYIIVPTYLQESSDRRLCSNAAVLVSRSGGVAGIYRKVHLVVSGDGKTMEGGSIPGKELPVFDCDFGKLAIQI